jgi:hypothetical protein
MGNLLELNNMSRLRCTQQAGEAVQLAVEDIRQGKIRGKLDRL